MGGTEGESSNGLGMGESTDKSSVPGVMISISFVIEYGGLCGRGDISMISIAGAGEEDGRGGVVMLSSIYGKVS